MIKTGEWLNDKFESATNKYGGLPSLQERFDYVESCLNDEIYSCEQSENIEETDYVFFKECESELRMFKVRKTIEKEYDESYVTILTESWVDGTIGFHIDKYYDYVNSNLIKELVKIIGFDFNIKRDKFNKLMIVVKSK